MSFLVRLMSFSISTHNAWS